MSLNLNVSVFIHVFAVCVSLFNQIRNMFDAQTMHSRSGFWKPKELQTRRGKFGKMHRFLNSVIPQTISSEKN
jgi:hypothetical protein